MPLIELAMTQTRLAGSRGGEGVKKGLVVVAVTFDNVPPKGAPLVRERLETIGVLGAGALLQAVAVDNRGQSVQLAMAGAHGSFPVGAFLKLAVAKHDEGSPVGAGKLRCDRASDPIGRPWPSGPVFASTPGTFRRFGWPFSAESGCMNGRKVAGREKAAEGEGRIERRGAMALAEDESVPLRLPRGPADLPKHSEEKGGECVRRREVAADMTEARSSDHLDDVPADLGAIFPSRSRRSLASMVVGKGQ